MLLGGISGWGQTVIHSLGDITDPDGSYILASDFSTTGTPKVDGTGATIGTTGTRFRGTIDGCLVPITGTWNTPLFLYCEDATFKNIIIENVTINETVNSTGALVCNATGATRIYNCGVNGGSIGTSANNKSAGSLVGNLDGTSRVVNCYSYANITSGKDKGGIVGNNMATSKQSSFTTMVMNCVFYGDIAEGNNISPIYGGTEINNVADGMNNYNYYRYDSPYSKNKKINKYNRALAMEEKFITRFERYRLLLNSNKKLAAQYLSTATTTVSPNDIAKWVLETADRSITNPKPYPILKAQGYYPSIINPDIANAPDSADVGRNKGGKLGKILSVTISGVGSNAPDGASISTSSLTLQRTDKDFDRFNFNYDKVQLPYYNDIGTGNYTGNRVVTGWKITAFTGGTAGTFTAKDEWGGYNFADRNCTNKDKYNVSKRVFSQGAYFDVPTGVTAITIEPYWATAAYVSDQTYDVIYSKDYARQTFSLFGDQYTNEADIDLYDDGNKQKVYTSIDNAISDFSSTNMTVYDQAVVLVGNLHQEGYPTNTATPYTVMSIDMDHDNEPDYSYIFSHDNRRPISPIRYDFLNIVGIAEAQMPKGAGKFRNVSIFNLKGWFEITNTCVVNFSQFEYENSTGSNNAVTKSSAPLILLGGTFEQFVSTQKTTLPNKTKYIHVGGNAWFAKFGNGTHSDGNGFTPHIPISVTGGDYDEFYLTGTYQPDISSTTIKVDSAECYVSGGRFGEMAGASLEPIKGSVRWDINHADITNFYGGGVNGNRPVEGNITTDITNSHVDRFCGGPKFGDMSSGKKVITNATGCTFGKFFGAGYGGNSYNRVKYFDVENGEPKNYQGSYTTDRGLYFDGASTNANNGKPGYGKKGKGVATDFDYEYFVWSSGSTGARFYVQFVSFSLAKTHDVTSTLTNCIINNDYYGGGNLGKVNGTATSVLDNCTVNGNVYGGGYSASIPKVPVRNIPAFVEGKEPSKNANIGLFEMGEIADSVVYEWKYKETMPNNGTAGTEDGKYVYTDEILTTLGQVKNSNLTIKGTTTVGGDVYGGGALASMEAAGNVVVNLKGGIINGNVYGGGQGRLAGSKDANNHDLPAVAALVGNVEVNLNKDVADNAKGCVVKGSIFGCNNLNGTPKGNVTVHVYATQNANASRITNPAEGEKTAKVTNRYDVLAVYGGGNLAAYVPTDLVNAKANVIIDGCDSTSIRYVYGGGNAASTPATSVTVNGTYEIEELFGGGNGKDDIVINNETKPNPGANVGFYDYSAVESTYDTKDKRQTEDFVNNYVYGTGQASVNVYGGKIHRVFGGSNTKGNVRQTAVTLLDENSGCDFCVDEAYGGGKSAPMDAEAQLHMACIPGLSAAYGGAEAAAIQGNVTLNITNGTFDRVFGGNNLSGTINGSITVNIEETGCKPIKIGELYGGGNQAGYSVYGYDSDDKPIESGTTPIYNDPQVNIKSFTSIGDVYGGGLGSGATMVGNPTVNVNVTNGKYYNDDVSVVGENAKTPGDYPIPSHAKGKMGAINNVFGGGNAAKVIGNTNVNIGTQSTVDYVSKGSNETEAQTGLTVLGADIRGNVYGGGNNAEVTGNTNVTIGKPEP